MVLDGEAGLLEHEDGGSRLARRRNGVLALLLLCSFLSSSESASQSASASAAISSLTSVMRRRRSDMRWVLASAFVCRPSFSHGYISAPLPTPQSETDIVVAVFVDLWPSRACI
eukprot:7509390-Pyramimonas_sp.AAC.1